MEKMKTLIITIFDEKLFSTCNETFHKLRKLYYGLKNTNHIDIQPGDSVIDKIKNHGERPDLVIIHCCCRGMIITSADYQDEQCIQVNKGSAIISINAIKQAATNGDMEIPIILFTECGRNTYEDIEFVKPPRVLEPMHEYVISAVTVNKETNNFTGEFSCMLYNALSDFRLFTLDNLYSKLATEIVKDNYQLRSSNTAPSGEKSYMIDNYFIRLFKSKNTKTLIITIFDRELFTPNHHNFDRFEKLFGNLGNNVICMNIRKDDNIIERIKNSNIKPDFVFIYCCCGGGIINNEEVIQMKGNPTLTSINAIIGVATNKNADLPIFVILECGREKYNLNYIKADKRINYNNLVKYYFAESGDGINIGNTECQNLIYNRIINMDKITSNQPFDNLTTDVNNTGYGYDFGCYDSDYFAKLCFIQLFAKN